MRRFAKATCFAFASTFCPYAKDERKMSQLRARRDLSKRQAFHHVMTTHPETDQHTGSCWVRIKWSCSRLTDDWRAALWHAHIASLKMRQTIRSKSRQVEGGIMQR